MSRILKATDQERMESELGCRYSALLQLPYFNPVKMLAIDPMHNLFLGRAKTMVRKVWIENGYLDETKLSMKREVSKSKCASFTLIWTTSILYSSKHKVHS